MSGGGQSAASQAAASSGVSMGAFNPVFENLSNPDNKPVYIAGGLVAAAVLFFLIRGRS